VDAIVQECTCLGWVKNSLQLAVISNNFKTFAKYLYFLKLLPTANSLDAYFARQKKSLEGITREAF
jgi:hypothetical protein